MLYLSQAIGRPVLDATGEPLGIAASAETGGFATATRLRAIGSAFGGGAECST